MDNLTYFVQGLVDLRWHIGALATFVVLWRWAEARHNASR